MSETYTKENPIYLKLLKIHKYPPTVEIPDSASLEFDLDNLKFYVQKLEKMNVQIYFYELPVNPAPCVSCHVLLQ